MFGCWFSALLVWLGTMGITPPTALQLLVDDAQICEVTGTDADEAASEQAAEEKLASRAPVEDGDQDDEDEGDDEEGGNAPIFGLPQTVAIYNGF